MTDVVKECLSWEAEFNLDLEVCIRIQFNKQSLRVALGARIEKDGHSKLRDQHMQRNGSLQLSSAIKEQPRIPIVHKECGGVL